MQLVCVVCVHRIMRLMVVLLYQDYKLFTKGLVNLQLKQHKGNLGSHEHQVCFLIHTHNLIIIHNGISGKI